MMDIIMRSSEKSGINDIELKKALECSIEAKKAGLKKVLLLPPDITRAHSGAGKITAMYYEMLKDTCQVDIMPALGTHEPMSEEERREMFGDGIPMDRFIPHNWRTDVVKVGTVPGEYIEEISEGLLNEPMDIEVNKRLLDKSYDLIVSMGQVVPHEVIGMANYSKNIFVGCGGSSTINNSHMLGAVYGMEKLMGKDHSPVRKVFDYAEENFIKDIPLMYVLTVTTAVKGNVSIHGVFIGRNRKVFEESIKLSQEKNLTFIDKPFNKVVVYLDEKEFKSTWLGNKAVYRTRMAIADDGELIILAPGVRKFGEDDGNDALIRKYGYVGRKKVLELTKQNADLQNNLSVAAHLIHGSSDDRFSITYAVEKLTKEEVEGANFKYMPLSEAYKKYNPAKLKDGYNTLEDGEEIFYISNPALGLWADKSKF
ncbi:MAG TPA: lactate racemase domain-containing protein [Clostridiales bacterium]|nr:lactate racemase domain-containing protein [Clostridiales bacterium]